MNNKPIIESSQNSENVIEISELMGIFWQNKRQLSYITILFLAIGIIYSLFLPNIYRSETILAPSQEQSGLSSSMQGLSSLAGLAGLSLPENSATQADQAIETLVSKTFFINKVYPNIYLPDLMANPRWDPKNNIITYDNAIYNTKRQQWVRDVGFPYKVMPSAQEAHNYFLEKVLNVSKGKSNSFVTISIDHVSPHIARDWVELITKEINEKFRSRDHELALSSIKYLNNQISMTGVVEVRQALSDLLKNQIQTSMLTNANQYYVFSVLDPPIAPEIKNSPNRSLIVIFMGILGGITGLLIVSLRHFFWRDLKKD